MDKDSTASKVSRWVRAAWITGIIWAFFSSVLELAFYMFAMLFKTAAFTTLLFPVWGDVGQYWPFHSYITNLWANPFFLLPILNGLIIAALSFGVFKKNRACAIILLLHPVLYIVLNITLTSFYGGYVFWSSQTVFIIIFLAFASIFSLGVWGTFSYHKAVKLKESQ